jgi:hypothetical protein
MDTNAQDRAAAPSAEAAPGAESAPRSAATASQTIRCILCEGGVMKRAAIKPYSQTAGIALLVVGSLSLFLGPLGVIGLALALIGLYFLITKKDVWLCEKCDAVIERR